LRTAYISHEECYNHDTGPVHPERAGRLYAIDDILVSAGLFDFLRQFDAPEVTSEQLLRVHDAGYLSWLETQIPEEGLSYLDPDTPISPASLHAARRAAGAVVLAVDLLMQGDIQNAFCSVRPPGHHAEHDRAMGFCLFNNIAVGAAHALESHGMQRIAILDFDVHQGNGTEQMFRDDERVLFCSTFQHPFYPNTPVPELTERMVCLPLPATARSAQFRAAVKDFWLPAVERFRPEMFFVSAGFDAHQDDDMSGISLNDADFRWISKQIVQLAADSAEGRIVSVLEGGYELGSLSRCVEAHIRVLMGLH
jgi:acetoin utilization deacetylase AcuC-like enzyme